MDSRTLLGTYFRQQAEMAMPDAVIAPEIIALLEHPAPAAVSAAAARKPVPQAPSEPAFPVARQAPSPPHRPALPAEHVSGTITSRLSSLRPIDQLTVPSVKPPATAGAGAPVKPVPVQSAAKTAGGNRAALKELYCAGCTACRRSTVRKKLVFGSGNADAAIMVIGDAPGAADDAQGVPFLGESGQLLTGMLAAIGIDRANDVFLTTVVKCFSPDSDGRDDAAIIACLPLLTRQIAIIKPKALLLLGATAAGAVLGIHDDILSLRLKTHDYRGIPAVVTHHPASLLLNAGDKRAAWEDLQRFGKVLSTLGVYGSLYKK
jgi:DNA polymerase